MQPPTELCGIILFCISLVAGDSTTITCKGQGGVTCGGQAQLGLEALRAGSQDSNKIYCHGYRAECQLDKPNGYDVQCAVVTTGTQDPPYDKVLNFAGIYNSRGDFRYCSGTYYSGWGKDGCTC